MTNSYSKKKIWDVQTLQVGPYLLSRSSSLKALKSGPTYMGHPVDEGIQTIIQRVPPFSAVFINYHIFCVKLVYVCKSQIKRNKLSKKIV